MDDVKVINVEGLAKLEHERWNRWMAYAIPLIKKEFAELINKDPEFGSRLRAEAISTLSNVPCLRRWEKQMNTEYKDLAEKEKESDRTEVMARLEEYRK